MQAIGKGTDLSFEKSRIVQRGLDEKVDFGAMLEQIMEESDENNDELSMRIQHIQANVHPRIRLDRHAFSCVSLNPIPPPSSPPPPPPPPPTPRAWIVLSRPLLRSSRRNARAGCCAQRIRENDEEVAVASP